jgi:hypothetical protein
MDHIIPTEPQGNTPGPDLPQGGGEFVPVVNSSDTLPVNSGSENVPISNSTKEVALADPYLVETSDYKNVEGSDYNGQNFSGLMGVMGSAGGAIAPLIPFMGPEAAIVVPSVIIASGVVYLCEPVMRKSSSRTIENPEPKSPSVSDPFGNNEFPLPSATSKPYSIDNSVN